MATCTNNVYKELQQRFEELKKNSVKAPEAADDKTKDAGDTSENAKSTQKGLQELIVRMDEVLANLSKEDESFVKLLSMKSSLLYERAKIALNLNDYPGCQNYLEKALSIIEDLNDHPQIAYLYLRLMNHLAYVESRQGQLSKSKETLEKITSITTSPDIKVYSTEELFSNSEIDQTDASLKLYRLTINNLQMLGWVCSKMGLDLEYALKQHAILQYQLTFGECDPVDWSSRCARLAVLYMSKFNWVAARYHLSTASTMLDQLERDMVPHPDLGKAQAEIARGWIYYGIRLFEASKAIETNKRCNEVFSTEQPQEDSVKVPESKEEEKLDPALLFNGCDVKIENIPAHCVSTSEDARILFFQTHAWLKRARMFYTLRDHPYIYVNCILDLSELYRYLAYFEPDLECQYNVQKRRADALETLSGLLKDVRPQCYLSVSVEILRELAEVHLELMGLNLKRMYQVQGVNESQGNLKKRMEAVSDIHARLENFGAALNHQEQPAEEGVLAPKPQEKGEAQQEEDETTTEHEASNEETSDADGTDANEEE